MVLTVIRVRKNQGEGVSIFKMPRRRTNKEKQMLLVGTVNDSWVKDRVMVLGLLYNYSSGRCPVCGGLAEAWVDDEYPVEDWDAETHHGIECSSGSCGFMRFGDVDTIPAKNAHKLPKGTSIEHQFIVRLSCSIHVANPEIGSGALTTILNIDRDELQE